MSHVFPKYSQANGEVVDLDAVNENFRVYDSELNDKLNEHNFSKDAWTRTEYADDLALRLFSLEFMTSDLYVDYNPNPPSAKRIPPSGTWHVMGSKQFESKGGVLWIIASAQFGLQHKETDRAGAPGVMFGIRVDGALLDDSIDGTLDMAVEPVEDEPNQKGSVLPSAGHQLFRRPIRIQATPVVPAGNVTVELVAATMRPWNEVIPGDEKYCFSFEIIVVEMT